MNTEKLLENVKNTPLLEPELYEIIVDAGDRKRISKVLTEVLKRSDNKITDFDKHDMAVLFKDVNNKITDYQDKDGVFKSTPNTESLEYLSLEEDEELAMMSRDMVKAEDSEESIRISKEIVDFVWEHCNLKKEDLTDWERGLVESIYFKGATGTITTALDTEVGN